MSGDQSAREARYAEAMWAAMSVPDDGTAPADWLVEARAVLPLVDAEVAASASEAQAEIERLRIEAAENRQDIEGWKTNTREMEATWAVERGRVEFQRDRAEVHRVRAESAEAEVESLRVQIGNCSGSCRADGPTS